MGQGTFLCCCRLLLRRSVVTWGGRSVACCPDFFFTLVPPVLARKAKLYGLQAAWPSGSWLGSANRGPGWSRRKENGAWLCPGGHHRLTASPPVGQVTPPSPDAHTTPPLTPENLGLVRGPAVSEGSQSPPGFPTPHQYLLKIPLHGIRFKSLGFESAICLLLRFD